MHVVKQQQPKDAFNSSNFFFDCCSKKYESGKYSRYRNNSNNYRSSYNNSSYNCSYSNSSSISCYYSYYNNCCYNNNS